MKTPFEIRNLVVESLVVRGLASVEIIPCA